MKKILFVVLLAIIIFSIGGYAVCIDTDGDDFGTGDTTDCLYPEADCDDTNNMTHPLVNGTDYYLDHSLTVCYGTYYDASVHTTNMSSTPYYTVNTDIILDCNFSTFVGNLGLSPYFVFTTEDMSNPALGPWNITVKNCNISSYDYGIRFYGGGQDLNAINNNVSNCLTSGIQVLSQVSPHISSNRLEGNGFGTSGMGLHFSYSFDGIIDNNIFINNGGVSISIGDDFGANHNNTFLNNDVIVNENTSVITLKPEDSLPKNKIINLTINSTKVSFIHGGEVTIGYSNGIGLDNPPGYLDISKYVNITNSTPAWVFFNVSYDPGELGAVNESTLKMYRYNGAEWEQLADTGVNMDENYVWGNATNFSIFAPMGEEDSNCTYTGGNWYIGPIENCTLVGETLNVTGNISIYGNLTLSDVDMLVNLTPGTSAKEYSPLSSVTAYNVNTTSNWIRVFPGGRMNIINLTNITANESWADFWCGYEFVAFRDSTLEVRDSYFKHIGCNNRSDYSGGWQPAWTRFHGMRIETDNSNIINNTFMVNASWGVNLWNSSYNLVENNSIIGVGITSYGGGVIVTNYYGGSNNTVFNNTIIDVHHGIYGWTAKNNSILNNTVYKIKDQNNQYGVLLYSASRNNTIANNIFFNLTGTDSAGIWTETNSLVNIFKTNIMYGNRYGITSFLDTNQIFVNNTIYDGFGGNDAGIRIIYGNAIIENNTIYSNEYGVYVINTGSPTLISNKIYGNTYGIYHLGTGNITSNINNITNNAYGVYSWATTGNFTSNNDTIINSNIYDIYSRYTKNIFYNLTLNETRLSFFGIDISIDDKQNPPAITTEPITNGQSFLNITNTTQTGWIYLNLTYDPSGITDENNLDIYEYVGGNWVALSGTVDTTNNFISKNITSFSDFGIFEDTSSFYQCYYSNNTGVNITDGIIVETTEDLRCNDATIYMNSDSYIDVLGNLTFENITLIFDMSFDGGAGIYTYSGGRFTSNNSNITSVSNHYYIISDTGSVDTMIMNTNITECGYSDNLYERGIEIYDGNIYISDSIIENSRHVWIENAANVNLTNNTFRNMYYIDINSTVGAEIINNTFIDKSSARFNNVNHSLIQDNRFYGPAWGLFGGSGLHIMLSGYNQIIDNYIDTYEYVIKLETTNNTIITSNYFLNGAVNTVSNFGGINNTFSFNEIVNGSRAIDVSDSYLNIYINNTISGSSVLDESSNNETFANNTIINGNLMLQTATKYSLYENNMIYGGGISVLGSPNNTFRYNTIRDDYVPGISGNVITVSAGSSSGNIFENNTITNVTDARIYIGDTSSKFYNQTIENTLISAELYSILLKEVSTLPTVTEGLLSLNAYINITNNSQTSWIYLNLTYDESLATNESNIGLYRYNGTWSNVSTTKDTTNNYVYGNITSFSIFAALEPDLTSPIRSNGQPTGTITTTSTTVSLNTDELATCRYSETPNTAYDSMSFTTSSSTSHSWIISTSTDKVYTYYVRCSDASGNKNTDDYIISFTKESSFVGGDGGDVGDTDDTGTSDPTTPATEIAASDIAIGVPFIPAGGLCIRLDDGTCLTVFGDSATLNELSKIDPADYKLLLCNQSYVSAYEINITVDKAYLCFDKSKTPLEAVSIYTFNGDWIELDEIIETDTEICGKIKSSPYMIAGFKTTPTQQSALEAITLAQMKLDETPNSELQSLLDQAKEAYFRCDYEDAYNLAQQAMQLEVSAPTLLTVLAIITGISAGYYLYKHPIKFKKNKRKKTRS